MPDSSASSFTGAIATPHTLATEAAVDALRDGGSAVDAAIAAAAVLTVVYPHNVALGGDLIALVRSPDGAVTCVNASGWAGAAADVAAMRAKHGSALPDRGADTVSVPGGVRGWEALHRMGSRLPWHRLLQPAVRAAEVGVPVARSLGAHLADPDNADLHGLEDFDRVFRPDGRPLRTGEEFRQPALAATFAALAQGGPDEFYCGDVAADTVRYLRSHGSVLDAADFAEFQPEITAPLSVDFRGMTVSTSPPNTHGFIMLRALMAIDEFQTSSPLGGDLGTTMRVFHHGNRLRAEYLADPVTHRWTPRPWCTATSGRRRPLARRRPRDRCHGATRWGSPLPTAMGGRYRSSKVSFTPSDPVSSTPRRASCSTIVERASRWTPNRPTSLRRESDRCTR